MTDKYIDREETQVYGPRAAKMIRKHVVGLVPEADPLLNLVADDIDAATATVGAAVKQSRTAASSVSASSDVKVPVLRQAKDLLSRFSKHLDAHPKGTINRKDFFVEDGTVAGVSNAAPKVLGTISRITGDLAKEDSPVRDRATWHAEFSETMTALTPAIDNSDDARTDRRDATPTTEAARAAWMNAYRTGRDVVTGVLRRTGKLHLLPLIFYDLGVPAGMKVTAIPDDEDDDSTEPKLL